MEMAIIRQCDKCGTITEVSATVEIIRKRICCSPHDGENISSISATYDLCEKCAREIELNFITEEKADETIFY